MSTELNYFHINEQIKKNDLSEHYVANKCEIPIKLIKQIFKNKKTPTLTLNQINKLAEILHTRPKAIYDAYPLCNCIDMCESVKQIDCIEFGKICELLCQERQAYHHPIKQDEYLFTSCNICKTGQDTHKVEIVKEIRFCIVKNCTKQIKDLSMEFCRSCFFILTRGVNKTLVQDERGDWWRQQIKCKVKGCLHKARQFKFCPKCYMRYTQTRSIRVIEQNGEFITVGKRNRKSTKNQRIFNKNRDIL